MNDIIKNKINNRRSKSVKTIMIFITLVIAGLYSGCELVPGDDELSVEAVVTLSTTQAEGGDQITVDGSSSNASEDIPLQFMWTLDAPDGSAAELENPGSESTVFTADVAGDYTVTLEVTADNISASDQAVVSVTNGSQQLSGTISQDMTLFSDVLYRVVDDVTVNNGAKLTIQPGTVLEFDSQTKLEIASDGIISAVGTDAENITFTGTQQQAGWWDGIFVRGTTHPDNQLDYVIVEYGGGNALHSSVPGANLVIGRSLYDGSISVNNSIFRHGEGYGLFIHSNGEMPSSGNNTYTNNSEGPVGVYTNTIHYLDANSDYTGNATGNNVVAVEGNTLQEDATWQALNVPYVMHGNSTIVDAELVINAGAQFEFEAQTGLTFDNGSIPKILGTSADPVIFTGSEKQNGWWKGIFVHQTTHPDNLMEHAIVEYGGYSEFHSSTEPANLTVGRSLYDASISIKNSTFQYSDHVGLYVHSNGDIPNSSANSYSNNNEGAASVSTDKIHYLDSGSSYSGNGEDYVWVRGNTLENDAIWQPLDVPYGMKDESSVRNAEITIEPGAEFSFDAQASLVFGSGSVIQVAGTEQSPILFTGTSQSPGWWDGIHVTQTTHPSNTMDYVIIEYGGGGEHHSSVDPANLAVGRSLYDSYISITNSVFRNSGDVGLFIHTNSETNTDVCTANEFNSNGGVDCQDNQ